MVNDTINVARSVNQSKVYMYASDTILQLKRGMRSAQASNAGKLKRLVRQLVSQTVNPNSRTKCGFNHDEMGCMLIPVEDLEAYNRDLAGCRLKHHAFTY